MNKDKIMALSKICGTDGYPSKAGAEIIEMMEKKLLSRWDFDLTVAFVKAANVSNSKYDFEDLLEILGSKKQEGINNYDWNFLMANILFNLQDAESVNYMKQAIKIAGGNPEIDYQKTISTALKKVAENKGSELSDEEVLALYIKENGISDNFENDRPL